MTGSLVGESLVRMGLLAGRRDSSADARQVPWRQGNVTSSRTVRWARPCVVVERRAVRDGEATQDDERRSQPRPGCGVRSQSTPVRVLRQPSRQREQGKRCAEEERHAGHEVEARVVGHSGRVLAERDGRCKEQAEPGNAEQSRPQPPLRVSPTPRSMPTANTSIITPKTTKLTCCIQPFGPASSALTGSATGLNSSRRNTSWMKKVGVNSSGPTTPASAPGPDQARHPVTGGGVATNGRRVHDILSVRRTTNLTTHARNPAGVGASGEKTQPSGRGMGRSCILRCRSGAERDPARAIDRHIRGEPWPRSS